MTHTHQPPPLPSWGLSALTKIEFPFPLLKSQVELVLSQYEGVHTPTWDAKQFSWKIEYGTRPMERSKTGLELFQVRQGKLAAEEAAYTATQWFPDLDETFDEHGWMDDEISIYHVANARWCISELTVYTDRANECLFLYMNRLSGDRIAHWYIWNTIQQHLKVNALFLIRCPILQLLEGTEVIKENEDEEEGKAETKPSSDDHIQRYLFDTYVLREICTYLGESEE